MMGHARQHVLKEGALFASLVHAADQAAIARLRQQLVDNEREFHDISSEVISELPEVAADVETVTSLFDHLSATGWRAAAAAPQMAPEERRALLDGPLARELDELRSGIEKIELSLQSHDATYRDEVRGRADIHAL
jgi:hypothetical protein